MPKLYYQDHSIPFPKPGEYWINRIAGKVEIISVIRLWRFGWVCCKLGCYRTWVELPDFRRYMVVDDDHDARVYRWKQID